MAKESIKMIHTVDTMTIRRYGELDRTENMSLLKRWFNPFPVRWFDTEPFFQDFKKIFISGANNELNNEVYRMLAYNKIVILDTMLKTMAILMQNQNERSLFTLVFKQKVRTEKNNMPYYIEQVKRITGIEVENINDLTRLQKEIQRLLDKFNERFKEKKPQVKVDFMDIVLGVFSIMEMAFVPDMKLAEIGRLKVLADKRVKAHEKLNKKKRA